MDSIIHFDVPTRVIMHFAEDEQLCAQHGHRLIHYQVEIDPSEEPFSPGLEYIRFDHGTSEVHGWVRVDSVVIDTILEKYDDQRECWYVPANKGLVANG